MNFFTSEKGRDRANALRAIEGLQQGDQSLAHLSYQSGLMLEQTNLLRYMADRLFAIERELHALKQATSTPSASSDVTPTASTPPPPPPV